MLELPGSTNRSMSEATISRLEPEPGSGTANGLSLPDGNAVRVYGMQRTAGLNGSLPTNAWNVTRLTACSPILEQAPMGSDLLLARLPVGSTFLTPISPG